MGDTSSIRKHRPVRPPRSFSSHRIVFSALSLLNIPIGTAIGAYSLWALLRAVPQLQSGSAPVRSGATQSF